MVHPWVEDTGNSFQKKVSVNISNKQSLTADK